MRTTEEKTEGRIKIIALIAGALAWASVGLSLYTYADDGSSAYAIAIVLAIAAMAEHAGEPERDVYGKGAWF